MQASDKPVREFNDITASLLDVDGSCRDLNFENPRWSGVCAMLDSLMCDFELASITDAAGANLSTSSPASIRALASAGGRAVLEGGAFIKHLQVFIFRENGDQPFVELTFFPQDVVKSGDVRRTFLEWADTLKCHLEADRFYARYENASWHFGDCGQQSGVFAVSGEINADA